MFIHHAHVSSPSCNSTFCHLPTILQNISCVAHPTVLQRRGENLMVSHGSGVLVLCMVRCRLGFVGAFNLIPCFALLFAVCQCFVHLLFCHRLLCACMGFWHSTQTVMQWPPNSPVFIPLESSRGDTWHFHRHWELNLGFERRPE